MRLLCCHLAAGEALPAGLGCRHSLQCRHWWHVQEYLSANPDAKLISLGIGDTTHPLPAPIADAMAAYCKGLGTLEG